MREPSEWLRGARSVAVLTGAGISAESGIPVFRGTGGLWRQYRPEQLATAAAFVRDARLVWEWYDWRRGLIAKANPNPGHYALVELENKTPQFTLITQNVDGLHERAGSQKVLKVHGDIWRLRCTKCASEWLDQRVPLPELPPHCVCGALARPAVVWFGEALPENVWAEAEDSARTADVFLVVGTSAVVFPAAGLVMVARQAGARVIEINPERTPLSDEVDCSLRGPAGEILPLLVGH